jgi:type I restriction-modification system DNA methylase subunit
MNIAQIELNLQKLMKNFNRESFIYDLLLAYGLPKASITRLQKGNLNLSRTKGEISWKKKLFFKPVFDTNLHETIAQLNGELKHKQRFVIVTDYQTLLAIDTKTNDKLDIELQNLPRHFDFFLPWAGMEKTQHLNENPADVNAAEKMAKLFDEIKKDNPDDSPDFIHGLNVFLSRLLFCYFAEDTDIFQENQFTNAISSHTQADGGDLDTFLNRLFEVLNTPVKDRTGLPDYLNAFPYVNGGLFSQQLTAPVFTRRSRQVIIDSGKLQWKAINPDIFGSMFQAVIGADQRGSLGQHYTSVPNIMKVIEPLFINDLYEAFEKAKGNQKRLNELQQRVAKIKIFDPACGSGNFLIIAYKELRRLEMKIFLEIEKITKAHSTKFSEISLNNFYGIEIDDFAHEVAQLSLWLAVHQMNVEFYRQFGRTNPTLPLKQAGNIVCGNACRLDWEEVCPKQKDDEIYILGNPPYLGSSVQNKIQKEDLNSIFRGFKSYKNLDYIACWFKKGADYVHKSRNKFSFVSTNSITQGEQVGLLWPYIFDMDLEIAFAYQSFKWGNSAKKNAGVTVIIIGIRSSENKGIFEIYSSNNKRVVKNINGYLLEGQNIFMQRRKYSISDLPGIVKGNQPTDDGHLILNENEKKELLKAAPEAKMFIKKLLGSNEFIKGFERWCLWITEHDQELAYKIPLIAKRIQLVKETRSRSKAISTRNFTGGDYKFIQIQHEPAQAIIIPEVSSERRQYIPIGLIDSDTVITNKLFGIYNAPLHIFSVIQSRMHMVWVKTTSGKLETRISYSNVLSYNNFPFPPISDQRKQEITQCVFRILEEREKHPDKTLAQLYDPNKMPDGLREAHRLNDLAIERCYRSRPFESDEERLEYLFKLYEKMIAEEQERNTLFAKEKKTRKKK